MPDGTLKTTCKAKGIPLENKLSGEKYLTYDMYEKQQAKEVVMKNRLKKVGYGKNMPKDMREMNPFSIAGITMTRTFYKNSWEGMDFEGGKWYPHGYEA